MNHKSLSFIFLLFLVNNMLSLFAQENTLTIPEPGEKTLLTSGWMARRASEIKTDGNLLSSTPLEACPCARDSADHFIGKRPVSCTGVWNEQ